MKTTLKGIATAVAIITIVTLNPINFREIPVLCSDPEGIQTDINEMDQPEIGWKQIDVIVTAYCSCKKCTGWGKNITASGVRPSSGTIAAPCHIPFNTVIKLEGLGEFIVQDRGGGIIEKDGIIYIDVWMPSHEEALKFGRKKLKGWIKVNI